MRTEARRSIEEQMAGLMTEMADHVRDGSVHPSHPQHKRCASISDELQKLLDGLTELLAIELEREDFEQQEEEAHG